MNTITSPTPSTEHSYFSHRKITLNVIISTALSSEHEYFSIVEYAKVCISQWGKVDLQN